MQSFRSSFSFALLKRNFILENTSFKQILHKYPIERLDFKPVNTHKKSVYILFV